MNHRNEVKMRSFFYCGHVVAAALVVFVGCGGGTTTNQETKTANTGTSSGSGEKSTSVDADVGALDQDKVNATLNRTMDKLSACFNDGLSRIPFLGGNIKFALRINKEGAAKVAYLKESDIGDHATESCMLNALRAASWPAPVGGREGLAEGGFGFDPSPDERPPVALEPDQLGDELPKARKALSDCRSTAGGAQLKVTFYVDTEGKPMSAGVATSDPKGDAVAPCVVDALKQFTFASPGSYAGKITLDVD